MRKWIVLVLLGGLLLPSISPAIDLKQSKFTQVVNNVEIISSSDKSRHAAAVNDVFSMPDALRTGPNSRAELSAADGTITRVGANTIFQFDPLNRTIDLQQGSLLFHSPKGKGGGTIRTGSATASVIGTTIIITATPNGGFKLLDLEGQAEVRFLNGIHQTLEPGQMTFILPSGQTSPILVFRLDSETKGSTLVGGFDKPLDSQSKINSEITQQLLQILNGTAADTGLLVGNNATPTTVQVVQNIYNAPQPKPSTTLPDGNIVGSDRVSTLPVNYPSLDPNELQAGQFNVPAGVYQHPQTLLPVGIENPSPSSGFLGNNVSIDTAKVDLSSYAGKSDFDIVAANNLTVWQSVNFTPAPTPSLLANTSPTAAQPDAINLIAGNQMWIADGATLEADTGVFGLVAGSFNNFSSPSAPTTSTPNDTLVGVDIINQAGVVGLLSSSDFTYQSGVIYGGLTSDSQDLPTGGQVEIESFGNLTLGSQGTVSIALDRSSRAFSIYSGGDVDLLASGNLDVDDSLVEAGGYYYIAPDSTLSLGGDLTLEAGGNIAIQGSDLEAYQSASFQGNVTITGSGVGISQGAYIYGRGAVDITATAGDLDINNSEIDADGYIYAPVSDNDISPSIDLEAKGTTSFSSSGNLSISGQTYSANNINLTGAYVYAYNGDAVIENKSDFSISGAAISISSGSDITVDNISISDSSIYSQYDGISIINKGYLNRSDSTSFNITGSSVSINNIFISDSTIKADGDVNIYDYDNEINVGPDGDESDNIYDYVHNILISDSTITSDYGNVDIYAEGGGIDVEDSTLSADGFVHLNADSGLEINDSSITAGQDVNIYSGSDSSHSFAGNMYLSGDTIEAGTDVTISGDGNVTITGSSITADSGLVDIESGGTLTLGSSDTISVLLAGPSISINANGVVNLTSDNADVYDYDVYADYGAVSISAGGNVYLSGSDIESGYDTSTAYDVDINAGGTIDLEGTYVYATGDLNIESGDTLTLGQNSSYTVEAAGNVNLTSDNADVDSYGYDIYADYGDVGINAGGNVDIEGGDIYAYDNVNIASSTGFAPTSCGRGNVDINDSHIYAGYDVTYSEIPTSFDGGSVTIDAWNGHVDLYDDDIEAFSGEYNDGHMTIYANGSVDVDYTGLYADGDVTIESANTLTVEDSSEIDSYGLSGISLTSDNADVDVYDSSLYAYNGDVDITASATSGAIDIENAYVSASGDVNIESGGTLTLGGSDSISKLAGPGISINAGGVVNLTSDNADVDVYDYAIYANGSDDSGNGINVSANGNVDMEDSLDIYAENGGVKIAATGSVYLYDDDIYASWETGDGGMSIVSSGSTVDVDDTYLYAWGDVNIESSDTLTVEDSSKIDSYGLNGISLTSDNADVNVYDSRLYAYSGSVNIGASGNVNIESSDIYAYDNVNITSSTGSAPATDAFIPAPGSVDIENSYIYAGYNNTPDEISAFDGGSVNITAWNGDVDLYDDEIKAYGGLNAGTGEVNINASGSVDLDYVYDLYADDLISIEGVNTVTVEDGSDLEAYNGNVSLTSDNADVNITDSEVYSDYGNVNITAAGSVYVSNGNIQAGYKSDIIGDVNIHASTGTADFENTDIEAAGGIYIESSGTLTLNYSEPNDDDTGYNEVYAGSGPIKLKSDYGDVDIYNYNNYNDDNGGIYAEGGDLDINAGGGPTLNCSANTGGNVNLENSTFGVSGAVNVTATGNVYVDNSYFDMYDNGSINVNAGGNIDVLYTDGSGSSSINLTAGGYANVYDYALEVGSFNVTAGTYANFGADQYVHILNSTIAANGGDVNITGNSAGVDVDATTITGTGDINITAGGGYNVDSLSSGGHVAAAYVAPSVAGGEFVVLANFTPETFVEPVAISAPSDYIDENDVNIEDAGTVDLEANIDANIQNNSSLVSDGGNVIVNSGGTEEVDSSYIDANNGSVYLTAIGSVVLSDSLASSDIYSDIYADGGDVDIQSTGSTVDIEGTHIYALGSVNIESSGTLTLGSTSTSGYSIEAYDGDVSLTSVNSDVDAYNYSIYSDYGNVNISAGGNVLLSGDDIYSGYYADTGNVNIQSLTGGVDIEGTYIYASEDVGILSYGKLTLGNTSGYEIYADGWANLSSTTGDVDINNYDIYTYGSDVDGNGLTISAAVGNLNISGDSFYAYDNADVNMSALGAGSTVDVDGTYIYAGGDVNIESSGTLTVENSSTVESYGNNGISLKSDIGAVNLNDSSLYADNADVNIAALGASGTIGLEDTYISAFGNVNIESSGTLTLGFSSGWTIDAGNAISLKSDNADVDIYNDYELDADGSDINGNGITISAGGNVDIEDDYDIYADYGGVKIAAVGSVYFYDDEVYAGYDTDYGNLNITSTGSTVDVDDTYLDAEGDVNIESGDTLTVENSSEIDSFGYNGISLTSDNADVDVNDSSLYAYYGNVDIYATGTSGAIGLQSDYITAYGNVNIESDSTLTMGSSETGGDTIYAGSGIYLSSNNGDVDVNNSFLYGGFDGTVDDITIHDGSSITADRSVNLNAYGATVSIYAPNGSINIGHTTINPGGGIDITGSTIAAGAEDGIGSVSIYSDGYFYVGGRSDTLFYDTIEGNNISIDGSTITANNGGVSIVNDAYASTADAVGFNVDNTTLIYGDINISGGSTITASGGNINISTASLELFNASSVYGSEISLNDISIYDSTIAASGGNVIISAGGYLTTGTAIVNTDKSGIASALVAPDAVSIDASGDICLYGYSGANLDVTTAEAGGKFDLESDNYVDVNNSSLTADAGDLHIYGDNGNVDLEYSTIKATLGNVDIEAGYDDFAFDYNNETLTLFGDTITAGGSVTLSAPGGVGILDVSTVGMTVDDVVITAGSISLLTHYHAIDLDMNDFGSSTLTAGTGDADIYADNGDVDVQGSTIKATLGNVNIGAGFIDVNNFNTELLTLNGATVKAGEAADLTSSGGIAVDGSGIMAASITLETLYGVVNLDVNDSGNSTLTAGAGDLDIYADNGNVDVEGSSISATHGNVNIGAGYTDDSDYNSETLTLNGGSITAGDAVTLTAQSVVNVNVDSSDTTTLAAGSGDVSVTSYHGNVDVENATVTAGDSVALTASGSVTVASGSIGANNNVTVTAGNGITINGTAVSADDTTYGNITLTSTAGMTTIQNGASMNAYNLSVNSPDGILIDGTSGGSIKGNTMNLTAGNNDDGNGGPTIAIHGADILHVVDLSSFTTVNIASRTIDLFNVTFGGSSIVNLGCYSGFANVNNGVIAGEANLRNVTYGIIPILLNTQVATGIGTTPGIYVHAN